MEQASEREAGLGGARPLLHHGHSAFTIVLLRVTAFLPFIFLATQVRLRDTAAARVELEFQILRVAEHQEIKGGA